MNFYEQWQENAYLNKNIANEWVKQHELRSKQEFNFNPDLSKQFAQTALLIWKIVHMDYLWQSVYSWANK
jgi:hypothetical protein